MTASDRDRSGPSRDPGQEWPARQRPARRRIFIAVDDTPSARASTVFAARLAALSEADLAALFVEEENVHQAAGFPVGFQMTRTGRPLPAIRESLEEAYRAQARNLRALVQDIAQSAHVQWSFDVRRGRLVATVTAEATARDMVVLRAADCRAGELDASARHAVTVRGAHLLIIGTEDKALGVFAASRPRSGGRAIAPACLAVSTGSKLSEAALSEARALAERGGLSLHVIDGQRMPPEEVADLARARHAALIVFSRDYLMPEADRAAPAQALTPSRFADAAQCPILIISGAGSD